MVKKSSVVCSQPVLCCTVVLYSTVVQYIQYPVLYSLYSCTVYTVQYSCSCTGTVQEYRCYCSCTRPGPACACSALVGRDEPGTAGMRASPRDLHPITAPRPAPRTLALRLRALSSQVVGLQRVYARQFCKKSINRSIRPWLGFHSFFMTQ